MPIARGFTRATVTALVAALRPSVCWAGCGSGLDCVDLVFGSGWPGLVLLVLGAGFASALLATARSRRSRSGPAVRRRGILVGGLGGATLVLLGFGFELPFALAEAGLALPVAGWMVAVAAVGLGGALGHAVRTSLQPERD